MPWNVIRPFLSHYAGGHRFRPADGWPTTRVWITHYNQDVLRLRTSRLWQIASLRASFREWAEREELVFKVSEMATDKGQEPYALVYTFWTDKQEGVVVDEAGKIVMRPVHHTVSLMDDAIRLHCLAKHAFSWIVDTRNDRDPETYQIRAMRPEDMPPDDVAALETLLP